MSSRGSKLLRSLRSGTCLAPKISSVITSSMPSDTSLADLIDSIDPKPQRTK